MQREIVSREEWLEARRELLKAEKEWTRRGDELTQQRLQMPCVRVEKPYAFETAGGNATLAELFQGRSQLMVYHFMFGADYEAGCVSCSSLADSFNGMHVHLENHDVKFYAISRAPLAQLQAYQNRMGWNFPWASSGGSEFNQDFGVAFTEEQQFDSGLTYNFREEPIWLKRSDASPSSPMSNSPVGIHAAMTGTDVATYTRERPGMSAFQLEDGVVYHTYSAFSRGLDTLWSQYQWLDRSPKGRNDSSVWLRRRDEYQAAETKPKSCCQS